MAVKKTKNVSECCSGEERYAGAHLRPPMSSMCYSIGGALSLLAGIIFILGAYGQLQIVYVYLLVGLLLAFHGIGGILHVFRACPMCKAE
jgi:hypothetical protein